MLAPDIQPGELRDVISGLLSTLNACPAFELPEWTLNPTEDIARAAQHTCPELWDDAGNIAGSVLMLILLRPLVFGMPWLPPLRIFGVPPPASLLHLDNSGIGRPPHDNHRTNVLEGLLGWFRQRQDAFRGDLLQDAWLLVKSTIAQQQLCGWQSWIIARRILNATRNVIAPGIAQGSQDIWQGRGAGGGSMQEEEAEPEQQEAEPEQQEAEPLSGYRYHNNTWWT